MREGGRGAGMEGGRGLTLARGVTEEKDALRQRDPSYFGNVFQKMTLTYVDDDEGYTNPRMGGWPRRARLQH